MATLADDFNLQPEGYDPEDSESYWDFEDYLRALSGDDPRIVELDVMLRPFLDNDDRLDGPLYPDGDAMRFMDSRVPGDTASAMTPGLLHSYQRLLGYLATFTRHHSQYSTDGPIVPTLAEPTPEQRSAFQLIGVPIPTTTS